MFKRQMRKLKSICFGIFYILEFLNFLFGLLSFEIAGEKQFM